MTKYTASKYIFLFENQLALFRVTHDKMSCIELMRLKLLFLLVGDATSGVATLAAIGAFACVAVAATAVVVPSTSKPTVISW